MLVESIDGVPDSRFQAFDYLYPGQAVELGASGVLVLSYLDSCVIERIKGGRVIVGPVASKVVNGMLEREDQPCQVSRIQITQETGEGAGTVYRVIAFDGEEWNERTIKSDRPVFKWESRDRGKLASVVLLDMDRNRPAILWSGFTDKSFVAYPENAPALEVGMPYQVQVTAQDGRLLAATFSYDPDLDGPPTGLSRLVPVEPMSPRPR